MQGYLKFKEIDEELYEMDVPEKPSNNWLKQMAYFLTCSYLNLVVEIKKWFHIITVKEIYLGLIFILPISNIERNKQEQLKKCIPKVKRLMKKYHVHQMVLAEELRKNEAFLQEFQNNRKVEEKVHILDGTEMMPYLIKDIVEYVSQKQGKTPELEDIYLLIKNEDYRYKDNIIFLAQHFKTVNIVTTSLKAYQKFAKQLEEKQDIIVTVTNNKKKSLKRAKWIINFDLQTEEIKKYTINRTASIIYLNKKGLYEENNFEGLHICRAGIDTSQEIKDFFEKEHLLKQCSLTILYESTIDTKQSFKKVIEGLQKDKIRVKKLYGRRGILTDKEYERKNFRQDT